MSVIYPQHAATAAAASHVYEHLRTVRCRGENIADSMTTGFSTSGAPRRVPAAPPAPAFATPPVFGFQISRRRLLGRPAARGRWRTELLQAVERTKGMRLGTRDF